MYKRKKESTYNIREIHWKKKRNLEKEENDVSRLKIQN